MSLLARWIVRYRFFILAAALFVLLPCLYGLRNLRIEYDLMTYMPPDTPSAKGQLILNRDFGFGAMAYLLVKDKPDWEVERLKRRVGAVPGVGAVVWIDDLTNIAVPRQYMDQNIRRQFYNDGATAMQITFAHPSSSMETRRAIQRIQALLQKGERLAGQSVTLVEMRNLADAEKPRMLAISLALVVLILLLTIPSPVVPFLFLCTLGFAVAVNLGLNYFFGYRISYLTNSVVTALQLGVSLDFCIFLWERYREERAAHARDEAMAIAIRRTSTAVLASSITTVLGFLALAFMRNGLGADLGITMARGVLFSLLACLTILPALLLAADRLIFAWQHRSILPDLGFLARFVTRVRLPLLLAFILLFIPAYYSYRRVKISYDLESTFPAKLASIQAAEDMRRTFGSVDTLNLVTRDIGAYELGRILARLERVPGIKGVTSYQTVVDPAIPALFVPDQIRRMYVAGRYCNSTILLAERAASPATKRILAEVNAIIRPYGDRAYLAGQPAIMAEMAAEARSDLPRVNTLSLVMIFAALLWSFLSLSLPAILILAVQLAIWFNQGLSVLSGEPLFYFGTIAIGAIQLGSTVDYAVLLTTRFREELARERPVPAMIKALGQSARAIMTSAATLFAANMGIYAGTSMDLVKGLVALIARGAVITVAVVLVFFPAVLLILNPLIRHTTLRWPKTRGNGYDAQDKGVPACTAEP
ncbi:MAG: efflux RND transporter permease subunit [Patescibacteria group bacterium]